jgi:ERCC4-type nuclease
LKRKFEKIEQQEQEAAKQNERIEEERRRQEYLKSPEYKKIKERKLVFENLLTIPGLSEDIINCLFDKCPTKHAIINSSIEALAEVPGISNNLAKAIHARLKKT